MAAPLMELRHVPPGVDAHVHRGADNLVRLLPGSRLHLVVQNLGLTPDPDDASTQCVPHHVLEGYYARVLVPSAVPDHYGIGDKRIKVSFLCSLEIRLFADGLSAEPCSAETFLRRLERLAATGTYMISQADFEDNQPFDVAATPNDTWLSNVGIGELTDASDRLSVFADLAMLAGPRALASSRLLSSPEQFSFTMQALARAACTADGGLTPPSALPAVAPVAPVPATYGPAPARGRGGRGRGRGGAVLLAPAIAGTPGVPAAPMPSGALDEDILLAVAAWLRASALPLELAVVPTGRRDVRLEIQARTNFASDSQRENVIRLRLAKLLACLPNTSAVVGGVSAGSQLEHIRRLALSLLPNFDAKQVASFRALDDKMERFMYTLGENGGNIDVDSRVAKVLAHFHESAFDSLRVAVSYEVAQG